MRGSGAGWKRGRMGSEQDDEQEQGRMEAGQDGGMEVELGRMEAG